MLSVFSTLDDVVGGVCLLHLVPLQILGRAGARKLLVSPLKLMFVARQDPDLPLPLDIPRPAIVADGHTSDSGYAGQTLTADLAVFRNGLSRMVFLLVEEFPTGGRVGSNPPRILHLVDLERRQRMFAFGTPARISRSEALV